MLPSRPSKMASCQRVLIHLGLTPFRSHVQSSRVQGKSRDSRSLDAILAGFGQQVNASSVLSFVSLILPSGHSCIGRIDPVAIVTHPTDAGSLPPPSFVIVSPSPPPSSDLPCASGSASPSKVVRWERPVLPRSVIPPLTAVSTNVMTSHHAHPCPSSRS